MIQYFYDKDHRFWSEDHQARARNIPPNTSVTQLRIHLEESIWENYDLDNSLEEPRQIEKPKIRLVECIALHDVSHVDRVLKADQAH